MNKTEMQMDLEWLEDRLEFAKENYKITERMHKLTCIPESQALLESAYQYQRSIEKAIGDLLGL